jgi:hypothetical protein
VKVASKIGKKRMIFFYRVVVNGGLFSWVKEKFPVIEEKLSLYINEMWHFGYTVSCEMC